jgi:ABC-type transport system involved in multi-copper enzyme maturation permease subunit
MFFAPIITLDLVTAARRMRYFIVRVVYALVLLFLLWTNYSAARFGYSGTTSIREVAAFSAAFFATFATAQLVAIMLLTPAMIAGCIAQERERKTIEYLFSSTLTNGEIVLSKYVARTVHVAAILVVGLPVLAMTMMLGGVDPELLLMVFVVTLATLIGLSAMSIAVSVRAKRGRDAVVRTYILLIAFLAFPWICYLLQFLVRPVMPGGAIGGGIFPQGIGWDVLTWILDSIAWLIYFNPFYLFASLYFDRYAGAGANAWVAVGYFVAGYLGYAALILTWSTLSIRRVYRKSVGAGAPPKRRAKWFAELRQRPPVGAQPMVWKELFAETAAINLRRFGQIIIIVLFAAAVVPAYWMFIYYSNSTWGGVSNVREEIATYTMVLTPILMHAALLIIMVRAAGSITAERERDSWLTLISTPMSGAEIVWGKILGSLYAARWFLVPIGLLWLLTGYLWPETLLILPLLGGIFACVALSVAATGVWFSCWCATSIRAIASGMGTAIFVGGGYVLFCCLPFMFASNGGDQSMILGFSLCVPMLLGAPGSILLERLQDPTMPIGNNGGYIVMAVIIGTIAYAFIGMLMASATVANFDALMGRVNRLQDPLPRGPRPQPPKPKPLGPEDVDVVQA